MYQDFKFDIASLQLMIRDIINLTVGFDRIRIYVSDLNKLKEIQLYMKFINCEQFS